MSINKTMLAALKALSYTESELGKTYLRDRKFKIALGKPMLPYRAWEHTVKSGDYEIPVRIFLPEGESLRDVILFFHGGGWVVGTLDSYTRLCRNLARLMHRAVIAVDYRLAPEFPFPAATEDCYAVARELYQNPSLLGITAEEITLMGDSAGGNLAAAVSLMARDRGEFTVPRQILLYPATHHDHSETSPFPSVAENGTDFLLTSKRICEYMDLYAGGKDLADNPYFSPLTASDLSRQPRTLVITAEFDPLRDEGEAYAAALRAAGNAVELHRIPDALHGYFSLPPSFAQVRLTYGILHHFFGGSRHTAQRPPRAAGPEQP